MPACDGDGVVVVLDGSVGLVTLGMVVVVEAIWRCWLW